jgi:CheY-like chemotaxis protein
MPHGGELAIAVDPKTLDSVAGSTLGLDEGEFIEIIVADTGTGMDDVTVQRCFEPFFTTKGALKGTGLGLAAARRLVEESGGVINCKSELGEGTTFQILLPSVVYEEASDLEGVPHLVARGTATILLAEDDDALRQMMVQVLDRNGYHVLAIEDGTRALELAGDYDGTIDLLVSDVVMPGLSGPELALTLQKSRPSLRVLLTSGTADASVLEGLAPRTAVFLAKPFRPSQLIDRVHELLARRP